VIKIIPSIYMLKLYKYIFYRMYCWNRNWSISQSFGLASMQAMSAVCTLLVLQFLDALLLLEKLAGIEIIKYFGDASILIWCLIGGVICLLFIALLGGEEGYKKIILEFDRRRESPYQSVMRGLAIWAYISFWVILFFVEA